MFVQSFPSERWSGGTLVHSRVLIKSVAGVLGFKVLPSDSEARALHQGARRVWGVGGSLCQARTPSPPPRAG